MRVAALLGVILGAPIFLNVSDGISLAPQYSGSFHGNVLSLSWFLGPMIIVFLALVRRKVFYRTDVLIIGYVGSAVVALLFGLISNGVSHRSPTLRPVLILFLQTVVPVIWFFVPRLFLCREAQSTKRLYLVWRLYVALSVTLAVFVAGYVLQTALFGGYDNHYSLLAPNVGPFYNYKIKRFFPVVAVILTTVTLARIFLFGVRGRLGVWSLAGFTLGLVIIATTWSRTAVIALFLSTGLVTLCCAQIKKTRTVNRVLIFGACAIVAGIVAVPLLIHNNVYSVKRVYQTVHLLSMGSDLGTGDVRRLDRMYDGVVHGLGSFTGDRYRLRGPEDQAGTGTEPHLLVTENGYLSIAVRTGIIGFICLVSLVVIELVASYRLMALCLKNARHNKSKIVEFMIMIVLFVISISVFSLGEFFLKLATEPYAGPIFWVTFGAIEVLRHGRYSLIYHQPQFVPNTN